MSLSQTTTTPSPPPTPPEINLNVVVPTPAPLPTPIVNNIAAEVELWDRLWPLLVTAALALSAALVVQVYVVPFVESRKRREQRWEEDVRKLGELLLFTQPKAFQAMRLVLLTAAHLASPPQVADSSRVAQLTRDNRDELRRASAELDEVDDQIRWLTDRIVSFAPRSQLAMNLQGRAAYYQVQGLAFSMLHPVWSAAAAALTRDDVIEGEKAMRAVTKELTEVVESIANAGPRAFRRKPTVQRRLIRLRDRLGKPKGQSEGNDAAKA